MKLLTARSNIIMIVASILLMLAAATGAQIAGIYEDRLTATALNGLWYVFLLATVGLAAVGLIRLLVGQVETEDVAPAHKAPPDLPGEERLQDLYQNADWVNRKLKKFRADRAEAAKDIDTIRALLRTMIDLAYGVGQKSVILAKEARALDALNDALRTGDPIRIQRAIPAVRDAEIKRMAGRSLDNPEYYQGVATLISRMAGEAEAHAVAYNEMMAGVMARITGAKVELLRLQKAHDASRIFEPIALLKTDLNRVERALRPFIIGAYEGNDRLEGAKEYAAMLEDGGAIK